MANGLTYQRTTTTPEATKQLAATLAPYLHAGDTIVLTGDLGAGKTQFVQGVAAALGVRAAVTSPTFNILLEYHDGRLPLYHYDLYRLDARWQLEDIDYYSAIDGDGDGAAFVEWAEKFPEDMPYDYLEIAITADGDTAHRRALLRLPLAPASVRLGQRFQIALGKVPAVERPRAVRYLGFAILRRAGSGVQ